MAYKAAHTVVDLNGYKVTTVARTVTNCTESWAALVSRRASHRIVIFIVISRSVKRKVAIIAFCHLPGTFSFFRLPFPLLSLSPTDSLCSTRSLQRWKQGLLREQQRNRQIMTRFARKMPSLLQLPAN